MGKPILRFVLFVQLSVGWFFGDVNVWATEFGPEDTAFCGSGYDETPIVPWYCGLPPLSVEIPLAIEDLEGSDVDSIEGQSYKGHSMFVASPFLENGVMNGESSGVARPICVKASRSMQSSKKGYYACDHHGCEYRADRPTRLKHHKQVVHEGVSYPCNYDGCEYKAKWLHLLERHKRLKHEGIRYACRYPGCEYASLYRSNLDKHWKAKHEGILRYSCQHQECDYQATQSNDLKRHIRGKHEGIMYTCKYPRCKYRSVWLHYFEKHMRTKHEGK